MNPFVIHNFSSNKDYQFHNKPPQVYLQLVQNGYISSAGRNNMPRYPYHTAGSYSPPPQNPKPLPENYMQFGPNSPLFNPIGQSSRSNWIGQNYSSPVNVLNGKVPVQNGYISSVGRNIMLRYTYHTVSSYSQQQNSKPLLPENRLQFGTSSTQSNPIGRSRVLNLIEKNYPSPVNVLNGKVKELAEYTHQTKLFRANNEMTMKKHPSCTEVEFVVKNFTKFPFRSNTNRMRLLHAFNKNFNLSRPTILDVHDRKRKKIASVEEEVVQNSYALLNAKSNKRTKPTREAQNERNKCMNNPNAMKKTEGPATSKIVIKEDENGYLRVCSEPLLESNNLTESVSSNLIGGNIKASLVDKDGDPTDLDLTLHL